MDVLSSQSNLAGYRAVIEASQIYRKAFPMMMTAAGTIPPARVLVMGAGVAGLQAIATAKRMGAIVSATDVRPAAKEQVESLGGKFVAVEDEEFKEAESSGGYAKQMSAAYQKKQAGDASRLYARNIFAFLENIWDAEKSKINISLEDEIVKGTLLTKDGKLL